MELIKAPFAPEPLTTANALPLPRLGRLTTIWEEPKASEAGRFSADIAKGMHWVPVFFVNWSVEYATGLEIPSGWHLRIPLIHKREAEYFRKHVALKLQWGPCPPPQRPTSGTFLIATYHKCQADSH